MDKKLLNEYHRLPPYVSRDKIDEIVKKIALKNNNRSREDKNVTACSFRKVCHARS